MQDDLPSMPLIGHLTELRTRLVRALAGVAVAYAISLTFTDPLWKFVCRPAAQALKASGYPPILYIIDPMDGFNIIWFQAARGDRYFSLGALGPVPGMGLHCARAVPE